MTDKPVEPTIAAVLLAAGSSRRFTRTKQLERWRGQTLVRRAANLLLASRARPKVAVVGHRAADVMQELHGLDIEIVHNPRYEEGQSTTVATGVRAITGRCAGALFVPCDQPLLTPGTLDRLIEEACEHRAEPTECAKIIRPRYGQRPGAPVLFPAELFDELLGLRGDEGGRQLFQRMPESIHDVVIANAAEGIDIDTQAELEQLD